MTEYGRAERQNERIVRSTIFCILCHQEDLIALEYGRQKLIYLKIPYIWRIKKKEAFLQPIIFASFIFILITSCNYNL